MLMKVVVGVMVKNRTLYVEHCWYIWCIKKISHEQSPDFSNAFSA